MLNGAPEGAISRDGRVTGSYLHGLFASDDFRGAFLAQLDIPAADHPYRARVESALDALADHIEAHLDVEGLLALAH
jgi:adenosylcobyric acid synthase